LEIKDFAMGLLEAQDLGAKLYFPLEITDADRRVSRILPELPQRPPELAFVAKPSLEVNLKKLKSLKNDRERGQILHFFANHELLAIELMALALLKFPEAPSKFRHQLIQTISDEQKHCRLYFERLQQCGVALGDVPLGAAFWNQLKDMASPEEYICAMCLTLEQANLDFALEYEQRFLQAGDSRTAEILRCVYEDEVFHVKVGVEWMERWKQPEESQWDFHLRHLQFPLSPARAKSASLSRQARLDCGLSLDYIEQLSQFQRSKGRPPDVYWFNGLAETSLQQKGALPKLRLNMETDMESVLSILACDDDLQILRRAWSPEFKQHLKATGRCLPETLLEDEILPHRRIGAFKPWMWTPSIVGQFGRLLKCQTRASLTERDHLKTVQAWNQLSSKAEQRDLEAALPERKWYHRPQQILITSESELVHGLEAPEFKNSWLLKAPYGSSGDGLRWGNNTSDIPWAWIKKILAQQHKILLEEQCQRRADYSLLGEVKNGQILWKGHTRMLIDARGNYKGAFFGDDWKGFNDIERRQLFFEGRPFYALLQEDLSHILEPWFRSVQYEGPFGIDCFVVERAGELLVRPLSEVNVRTTFGHCALNVEKRLKHGRLGMLFFSPRDTWDDLSFLKMQMDAGFWSQGFVACNDAWLAENVGVFCWAGKNLEELNDDYNWHPECKFHKKLKSLIDLL
jgi:uncharacterized ferritin-like protein (DUF455 family)